MSVDAQVEVYLRILLAGALGAAIGLEREYRGHEAGIRTSAFVCAGAALFGESSNVFGDSRIAAGVVQGIGFLGAGLIFQRGDGISGVTTAAMVWLLAGVGLMVAEDLWLVAILLTATAIVLLELSPVSDWVYRHGHRHVGEPDLSGKAPPPPRKAPPPRGEDPRHRADRG